MENPEHSSMNDVLSHKNKLYQKRREFLNQPIIMKNSTKSMKSNDLCKLMTPKPYSNSNETISTCSQDTYSHPQPPLPPYLGSTSSLPRLPDKIIRNPHFYTPPITLVSSSNSTESAHSISADQFNEQEQIPALGPHMRMFTSPPNFTSHQQVSFVTTTRTNYTAKLGEVAELSENQKTKEIHIKSDSDDENHSGEYKTTISPTFPCRPVMKKEVIEINSMNDLTRLFPSDQDSDSYISPQTYNQSRKGSQNQISSLPAILERSESVVTSTTTSMIIQEDELKEYTLAENEIVNSNALSPNFDFPSPPKTPEVQKFHQTSNLYRRTNQKSSEIDEKSREQKNHTNCYVQKFGLNTSQNVSDSDRLVSAMNKIGSVRDLIATFESITEPEAAFKRTLDALSEPNSSTNSRIISTEKSSSSSSSLPTVQYQRDPNIDPCNKFEQNEVSPSSRGERWICTSSIRSFSGQESSSLLSGDLTPLFSGDTVTETNSNESSRNFISSSRNNFIHGNSKPISKEFHKTPTGIRQLKSNSDFLLYNSLNNKQGQPSSSSRSKQSSDTEDVFTSSEDDEFVRTTRPSHTRTAKSTDRVYSSRTHESKINHQQNHLPRFVRSSEKQYSQGNNSSTCNNERENYSNSYSNNLQQKTTDLDGEQHKSLYFRKSNSRDNFLIKSTSSNPDVQKSNQNKHRKTTNSKNGPLNSHLFKQNFDAAADDKNSRKFQSASHNDLSKLRTEVEKQERSLSDSSEDGCSVDSVSWNSSGDEIEVSTHYPIASGTKNRNLQGISNRSRADIIGRIRALTRRHNESDLVAYWANLIKSNQFCSDIQNNWNEYPHDVQQIISQLKTDYLKASEHKGPVSEHGSLRRKIADSPSNKSIEKAKSNYQLQNSRASPGTEFNSIEGQQKLKTNGLQNGFICSKSGTFGSQVFATNISQERPPPPMAPNPPPAPPSRSKNQIMPSPERLSYIDAIAIEVSDFTHLTSFHEFLYQLTKECTNDVEVVRWTIQRDFRSLDILYSSNLQLLQEAAPESFLGLQRSIQTGQLSNNELFFELCRYAAIPCQYVVGHSKGAGYRPGMPLRDNRLFRNTWLAVFVGEGWRFVNCNWGSRYIHSPNTSRNNSFDPYGSFNTLGSGYLSVQHQSTNTKSQFLQGKHRCDEFYFLTDPDQHIFEHMPDHKKWQLLRRPINFERFVHLPLLKSPFFNAKLSLKKNYAEKLVTKNGQVAIKLLMPKFVGISCSLENCADGTVIRGLCSVEVLLNQPEVVRIQASPSQPGRYYLNIYVAEDWRREDCRELACSFEIHCSEHNYSRLISVGRLPEVGFLGRTPAAQNYGIALISEGIASPGRPLLVFNSTLGTSSVLKIPFAISPGLKICHQLKSFDRPGQQMADCDGYALLQMSPTGSNVFSSQSSSNGTIMINGQKTGASSSGGLTTPSSSLIPQNAMNLVANSFSAVSGPANGFYHIRVPVEAFYYLTIYASHEADTQTQHLECVYRLLIDARRLTPKIQAFPRQTYWWVGCKLFEPDQQALEIRRQYTFRLYAPRCSAVAVVINEHEWHHLRPVSGRVGRWTGKVDVGDKLGDLSVYGRIVSTSTCVNANKMLTLKSHKTDSRLSLTAGRGSTSSNGGDSTADSKISGDKKSIKQKNSHEAYEQDEDEVAYVKLLDYVLVYKGISS